MSAARFLCAGLAFGAAYLYGEVAKAKQRDRVSLLHVLAEDVSRLGSMLELDRLPLEDAFAAFGGEDPLSGFWKGMAAGTAGGSSPQKVFAELGSVVGNKEAQTALSELFSELGSCDADTEVRRLRACGERLAQIEAQAAAEAENSRKLTGSLSVMLGLAAALLLL